MSILYISFYLLPSFCLSSSPRTSNFLTSVNTQLWKGEETRRSRACLCILRYNDRGPLLTMWEFIFLTSPPPRYSFPSSCSLFISAFSKLRAWAICSSAAIDWLRKKLNHSFYSEGLKYQILGFSGNVSCFVNLHFDCSSHLACWSLFPCVCSLFGHFSSLFQPWTSASLGPHFIN